MMCSESVTMTTRVRETCCLDIGFHHIVYIFSYIVMVKLVFLDMLCIGCALRVTIATSGAKYVLFGPCSCVHRFFFFFAYVGCNAGIELAHGFLI